MLTEEVPWWGWTYQLKKKKNALLGLLKFLVPFFFVGRGGGGGGGGGGRVLFGMGVVRTLHFIFALGGEDVGCYGYTFICGLREHLHVLVLRKHLKGFRETRVGCGITYQASSQNFLFYFIFFKEGGGFDQSIFAVFMTIS